MERIAVVGLGFMGEQHVKVLSRLKSKGLSEYHVCVYDHDESRMHAMQAYTYVDCIAANELDSVDALVVATPPDSHYAYVRSALDKAIPVYVEKPVGMVASQTVALARCAAKNGIKNQVGLVLRHSPVVDKLRSIIASQAYGQLREVSYVAESCFPPMAAYRTPRAEQQVGILKEEAVHNLDTLMCWLGELSIEDATLKQEYGAPYETSAVLSLRAGDVPIQYESHWVSGGTGGRTVVLEFESARVSSSFFFNGDIVIEDSTPGMISRRSLRRDYIENNLHPGVSDFRWYSSFASYRFVQCLRSNASCTPTLEDAARVERFVEDVIEHANHSLY